MIEAICIGRGPSRLGEAIPHFRSLRLAADAADCAAQIRSAPAHLILAPLSALAALRTTQECAEIAILGWMEPDTAWELADWGRADDVVSSQASAAEILARGRRAAARRMKPREDRRQADRVTGAETLPAFMAAATDRAAAARAEDARLVLVALAVDGLDRVSAQWGGFLADALLRALVDRVTRAESAPCVRIDGQTFALLTRAAPDEDIAASVAALTARLAAPCDVRGERMSLSLRTGHASADRAGGDVAALLSQALAALRNAAPRQRMEDADEAILRGLDSGEFELLYQIAVDLRSGATAGAEALLRWRRPGAGLLLPSAFLPTRRAPELARRLTHWVVLRVLDDAAAWRAAGHALQRVSVNVSADEAADGSLIALARDLAARGKGFLDFEIALDGADGERIDFAILAQTTDILAALGFGVTLAPPGASTHLFAPHLAAHLKATRILVGRAALRTRGASKILGIFHDKSVRVCAQHVESAADLRLAADLGCDEAQGHYIAHPVPASELMTARA